LTERTVVHAFPGATALTVLDVYGWIAPDGLPGGSAHVHLASTEGYVVLEGQGRLQTLGAQGYAETGLRPGDCLWFTPGIIHRLVNDGGLRLLVIMCGADRPAARPDRRRGRRAPRGRGAAHWCPPTTPLRHVRTAHRLYPKSRNEALAARGFT
jgi:mannose-6-phosphate isomerase-like protein (cupin superfamily)